MNLLGSEGRGVGSPSVSLTPPASVGSLSPCQLRVLTQLPVSCQGLLARAPTGGSGHNSSPAGAWGVGVAGTSWWSLCATEELIGFVGTGKEDGVRQDMFWGVKAGYPRCCHGGEWIFQETELPVVWLSSDMIELGDLKKLPSLSRSSCLSFYIYQMGVWW